LELGLTTSRQRLSKFVEELLELDEELEKTRDEKRQIKNQFYKSKEKNKMLKVKIQNSEHELNLAYLQIKR
jgi:hypothetical protein